MRELAFNQDISSIIPLSKKINSFLSKSLFIRHILMLKYNFVNFLGLSIKYIH